MMNWFNLTTMLPIAVLAFLLVMAIVVLWRAQARPDFDIANMLKDDAGRESPLRFAILVSLAISSWGIVFLLINSKDALAYWNTYLLTWSGALVFIKAAEKWNGVLPGGRQ